MCCTAHLLSLTRCPVIKQIHWNCWEIDSSQNRLGLESSCHLVLSSVHTSSAVECIERTGRLSGQRFRKPQTCFVWVAGLSFVPGERPQGLSLATGKGWVMIVFRTVTIFIQICLLQFPSLDCCGSFALIGCHCNILLLVWDFYIIWRTLEVS